MLFKIKNRKQKVASGLSLVDVIIATAFIAIVFTALAGAFLSAIELSAHQKARIGAVAISNQRMELIRNLPYDDVGTVSGIPGGNIPQNENISLNGINYTRRVLIQYVDDPKDGTGALDTNGLTADYKRVKIETSWTIKGNTRSNILISNIVPKGIETVAGGGTLIINVFDALGSPIPSADVSIINSITNPPISINTFTDINGRVTFPGSPSASSYEIIVTNSGYSTAQTYYADTANPNPNPGHLTVIAGDTTVSSFSIDLLSTKNVRTFTPIKEKEFEDLFVDTSNIYSSASTTVSSGEVALSYSSNYETDGYVYSNTISDTYLALWKELSWNDSEPASTGILYRVYSPNDPNPPTLIPDSQLPGNSTGFGISPVDLSGIATSTYPLLRIGGFLSTADNQATPTLQDWKVKYDSGPTPLPSLAFNMRGTKTIGTDGGGVPIYKYNSNLQTDSSGILNITGLEWDTYDITINNVGLNLDISESCNPQPLSLLPGTSVQESLFFVPHTTNSLLVSITDTNGVLLDNSSIRLYRSGFDSTQTTSACGQTFFSSLSQGTVAGGNAYNMDVTRSGYTQTTVTNVDVSGVSEVTVILNP